MANEARNNVKRITFFGDSIFAGQGVSIYRGWVTQIAQFVDEYGATTGQDLLVTNSSINGRTTRQALEDMPYSVQSHGVDILVVQFGLNDCNYWATDNGLPRVSMGAFVENLKEIVARGKKFGAQKILVNNNHPTSRSQKIFPGTSITYEDSNRAYSQAIADMAKELGPDIQFQDVYTHFNSLTENTNLSIDQFLLADGLHLNQAGHDAYYELMRPVILSAIEDLNESHLQGAADYS